MQLSSLLSKLREHQISGHLWVPKIECFWNIHVVDGTLNHSTIKISKSMLFNYLVTYSVQNMLRRIVKFSDQVLHVSSTKKSRVRVNRELQKPWRTRTN